MGLRRGGVSYVSVVRRQVGLKLRRAPYGSQVLLAETLQVTTRTLRTWKAHCEKEIKRPGPKPKRPEFRELLIIAREWQRQAYPGSKVIEKALPSLRVRLIRDVIRELKLKKNKRYRRIRQKNRKTVLVKAPGLITAMDAATIKEHGGDFIVHRDRASLSTNVNRCEGRHHHSSDVLVTLETMKNENKLPLVLQTDNGSPFCSREVKAYLKQNQVIHLKSLPHVPQHNGSGENAVGNLKCVVSAGLSPEVSCTALNNNRLRAKLGFKTPHEVEKMFSMQCKENIRTQFYNDVSSAINESQLGTKTAYEKRKREREAILATLEKHSFITIIRGPSTRFQKPEDIT